MIEKNLFVLLILVLQLLKTTVPETLFNKVAGLACNFIKKESLAQVFSCDISFHKKGKKRKVTASWQRLRVKHHGGLIEHSIVLQIIF